MPQAASAHDTFWDFVSLMPGDHAHGDVGDVRPGHPAQLPDDGGLRRPHLPAGQRRRRGVPGQVPLEAAARRALARLGRGAEDRRQGPRLPPPRPVGGHRSGRLPGVRARPADRRREGRARVRLRPARRHQAPARGARPGAPRRQADAEPQPRQLLRRDRAGRLLRRERRARDRLHQRPAACRRGSSRTSTRSSPASAGRTSPRSRSTGRSRRCTTTSQDGHMRTTIKTGAALYHPNTIGGGCPSLASPEPAPSCTSRSASTGTRSASAARASWTTSARRRCSSTATRRPSSSTSSRRAVRARQGRAPGDPPARRRALRPHRRRAGDGRGLRRRGHRASRQERPGPAAVAGPQHGQYREDHDQGPGRSRPSSRPAWPVAS